MFLTRRPAFTIIEVLLALAITLLLSGAVMLLLLNLGNRRASMLLLAAEQQAVGILLDHLETDLATAVAGDDSVGAGVKGTATELAVLSRGVNFGEAARGADARSLGDLQGSRYVFEPGGSVIKARRWVAGRGASEGGVFEVVSTRVRRVKFRYFDGREWRSTFDSLGTGGLPVAVECTLWTGRAAGTEASGAAEEPWGQPDRQRVIVVPDGPSAAWKESR